MTGLKSGSGDDLWGDDGDDDAEEADAVDSTDDASWAGDAGETDDAETDEVDAGAAAEDERAADRGPEAGQADETEPETSGPGSEPESSEPDSDPGSSEPGSDTTQSSAADDPGAAIDLSAIETGSPADSQSYIVRRAVQDKSVQFERDERLTFFVHDDVAEGERDLITELQSVLGRDVPKFDVREAVYRAALRNPDDVLEALLEMGYSIDEE